MVENPFKQTSCSQTRSRHLVAPGLGWLRVWRRIRRRLPAKDWNLRQVERLQTAAGGPLTFAVLGDSRSNPAVFDRLLKALAGDPSLTFAIEVGDMVEQGTLEQFDAFFKQIRSAVRLPFLAVAGNHDLGKNHDLTLYREIFGPDYYAFQVKGNYFIMVNDVEDGRGRRGPVALAGRRTEKIPVLPNPPGVSPYSPF